MSKNKLEYISSAIAKYISLYDKKRQRNKFLSLGIKLLGAGLAAAITILLGLNISPEKKALASNIALIFGATITVLNTWDAFFNHRGLWIRFTVATQSLYCIKEELNYLRSDGDELTDEQLDSVHKEFKEVLFTVNRDWENLRKEEQPQTSN
jgi:hypothetical protein